MRVVRGFPPHFDRIRRAGLRVSPGVVFTYGRTVYAPSGHPPDPALLVHEAVHSAQQENYPGGPEAWWDRYLQDARFRLEQEVPAYQAQLRSVTGRQQRRKLLDRVSGDLAGPMYGNLVDRPTARRLISAAL